MTDTPDNPQHHDSTGILQARAFLFLAAATLVLQVVILQVHYDAFTGGWLTRYFFDSWYARLAGVLVLAVFTVATWGGVFLLGTWLLGRIGMSVRRSTIVVSIIWVAVLVADVFVRQKVQETVGRQFDLTGYKHATAGRWATILSYLWETFADAILIGLLLCVAAGAAAWFTFRVASHRRVSLGWLDRLTRRHLRVSVVSSLVVVLLSFTVFYDTWPTGHWASTRTLVGRPFQLAVLYISDIDGDGSSPFERPADTSPLDGSRHPFALDVPDDGIDHNDLLGDLHLAEVHPDDRADTERMLHYPTVRFRHRPNVVLVVLESMRFDTLEATVDGTVVLPNFRRMIAEGALLPTRAYASNGFSVASTSELFWGNFYNNGTTLVDDFNDNGYTTVTISGANELWADLKTNNGLDRCDIYKDPNTEAHQAFGDILPVRHVLEHVETFLAERDSSKPFFLYTDIQEPHFPYNVPTEYVFIDRPCPQRLMRSDVDWLRRSFYNQVHAVDAACAKLVRMIESSPGGRDTLFVFVSDHGEALMEGGVIGHGLNLNEVQTHLMMVVRNARRNVPDVIGHVDIRGMIRDMLTQDPVENPRVVDNPDRRLLLYTWIVERPLRIGDYSAADGRLTYNFNTGLVHDQTTDTWLPLEGPDDPAGYRQRARRLIRRWEYLRWKNRDNQPLK